MFATQLPPPPALTTPQFKRFGPFGPVYQVERSLAPLPHGDWAMEITLVETGEKLEYPYSKILQDMDAE